MSSSSCSYGWETLCDAANQVAAVRAKRLTARAPGVSPQLTGAAGYSNVPGAVTD
jgi:hypothetical protein